MLTTNANFDAKHALATKTPLYMVEFDLSGTDAYANHEPASGAPTTKKYLVNISGLSQKVVPEQGRASIGGVTAVILDVDNEITAMLATDDYFFHRMKTTIKAGYLGMAYTDLITIFTGWVTGLKLTSDGLAYEFSITDPQKWMQRKVFRGAEDATVSLSGNAINIMLAVLTSTGAGTNGDYDWFVEENGLGLDTDFINIAAIEAVRDDWFPGASNYLSFTINERIKAKDWLEKEIFKPLNLYPVIDGDGKFNLKPFKPPLADSDAQSFTEDNIIGLPTWSANLDGLINEVEFHYDYDEVDDEFDTQDFYIQAASLNNRGPGKDPIVIKTKGIHSTIGSTAGLLERRKNKIFGRYAIPPIKLGLKTFFSRFLSEAGDIVPVTHGLLPDLEAGSRGLSARNMEIINRTVDWKNGQVKFDLLDTGFDRGAYMQISPSMTVTSGVSTTVFNVSSADAAKYTVGWVIDIMDANMHAQATDLTISDITGGQITVSSSIGATPAAGWIVAFAEFNSLTAAQQEYWAIPARSFKITIDKDKIDGDLTDYPVLINLTAASGIGSDDVTDIFDILVSDANRKKIKVTAADGTTQLYVEIERWDTANKSAQLWVKVPSISAGQDTILYLHYSANYADNTTYVGDIASTPAKNVWKSDFKAVWHLSQDPSVGGECIKDSTSYGQHGTPQGSMTDTDVVDGKFGKALEFDGSDDYIQITSETDDLSPGEGLFTIQMLHKTAATSGQPALFFNRGLEVTGGGRYADIWLVLDSTNYKFYGFMDDTWNYGLTLQSSYDPLNDDAWHLTHFARIVGASETASQSKWFVDGGGSGQEFSSPAAKCNDVNVKDGADARIGDNALTAIGHWDGEIQEVRWADVVLSDEWIMADKHCFDDNLITFSETDAGYGFKIMP